MYIYIYIYIYMCVCVCIYKLIYNIISIMIKTESTINYTFYPLFNFIHVFLPKENVIQI